MNNCPTNQDHLSAFVDSELSDPRRRQAAGHVLECDDCAAQVGRLLAVKAYISAEPEESAALGPRFWRRLAQALDVIDAVGERMAPRPQRRALVPRLAALAAAGAAVVVLALALRVVALAPPRVAPPAPATANSTGSWMLEAGLPQELYRVSPRPVSLFSVPPGVLDLKLLQPVRSGDQNYYVGVFGFTSLLAWEEQGGWRVLTGEVPPEQLLELAASRSRFSLP